MIAILEEHGESLAQLCKQYRVSRLEVFGSAATGADFDPQTSDIDLLVEFLPLQDGSHADTYFGLHEALERLLGRTVDLVMTRAIRNRFFLESVNQTRTVLYAA